jgi:hypothetical protein
MDTFLQMTLAQRLLQSLLCVSKDSSLPLPMFRVMLQFSFSLGLSKNPPLIPLRRSLLKGGLLYCRSPTNAPVAGSKHSRKVKK